MKKITRKYFLNLSVYPARSKAEMKVIDKKPFGDKDKDKVLNYFDCKPLNKHKQGFITLYHGTTKESAQKIKKEGLKKDIGINPVVYLTPKLAIAKRYGGKILKVRIDDEKIKSASGEKITSKMTEVTVSQDIPSRIITELE